jgi:hypothetical protein
MCAPRSSGVTASLAHFKDSSAHARYSAAVVIFYFHIAAREKHRPGALVLKRLFVTVEIGFTNHACRISSGSLAMFAAVRRTSSSLSYFAAERRPDSLS